MTRFFAGILAGAVAALICFMVKDMMDPDRLQRDLTGFGLATVVEVVAG